MEFQRSHDSWKLVRANRSAKGPLNVTKQGMRFGKRKKDKFA